MKESSEYRTPSGRAGKLMRAYILWVSRPGHFTVKQERSYIANVLLTRNATMIVSSSGEATGFVLPLPQPRTILSHEQADAEYVAEFSGELFALSEEILVKHGVVDLVRGNASICAACVLTHALFDGFMSVEEITESVLKLAPWKVAGIGKNEMSRDQVLKIACSVTAAINECDAKFGLRRMVDDYVMI